MSEGFDEAAIARIRATAEARFREALHRLRLGRPLGVQEVVVELGEGVRVTVRLRWPLEPRPRRFGALGPVGARARLAEAARTDRAGP